jgi:phosphatidylserine/phosphatidylglycerophosphate/cardiolipin synthase-like enzyme
VNLSQWFLTNDERGNPATDLDRRHRDNSAWTTGNHVRALVHGAAYFTALLATLRQTRKGDLVLFTDWRGDPDQRLGRSGTAIGQALSEAAERGVVVKGLIWRSHMDKFQFSEEENRHLGEEIEAAGGEALLDMRVRAGGSHHQKMVVVRHLGRPDLDVAYIGGIDLCHGRNDDATHRGDPQAPRLAAPYGRRPPWHDVQLEIRGPAVGDVETVFRERWGDPAPLSRNPLHRLGDLLRHDDTQPNQLPSQLADPAPEGSIAVQLLRTYPYRRNGYAFAPHGERSVARGYAKAVSQARRLIYLEDQYMWSADVVRPFAEALERNRDLHLVAVVPLYPDVTGRFSSAAEYLGRDAAMAVLHRAGGDRVAVYGLENHHGTPVYVHAKVCIIDDCWATVGSDNLNLRSWTYDSELSCAILDESGDGFPGQLRLALAREHTDRVGGDDADLRDPAAMVSAFAEAAHNLDQWHAAGRQGPRPIGRLRRYQPPVISSWVKPAASVIYRWLCDPDGRPPQLRRAGTF